MLYGYLFNINIHCCRSHSYDSISLFTHRKSSTKHNDVSFNIHNLTQQSQPQTWYHFSFPIRRILSTAIETEYININCVDPLGRSALLMAIDNENLEMVELLINSNVDTKDALLHAISEEFVEAVEMLLDHEDSTHSKEGHHVSHSPWIFYDIIVTYKLVNISAGTHNFILIVVHTLNCKRFLKRSTSYHKVLQHHLIWKWLAFIFLTSDPNKYKKGVSQKDLTKGSAGKFLQGLLWWWWKKCPANWQHKYREVSS